MNKEDADQEVGVDEPFLNETLAYSEISELFEPKVLVNAKRYDKNGGKSNLLHHKRKRLPSVRSIASFVRCIIS